MELEGLDYAHYETDFYPEYGRAEEMIIMEDGREVPSASVLRESYQSLIRS